MDTKNNVGTDTHRYGVYPVGLGLILIVVIVWLMFAYSDFGIQ